MRNFKLLAFLFLLGAVFTVGCNRGAMPPANPVPPTPPAPPEKTQFNMVVTSDPQYPWYDGIPGGYSFNNPGENDPVSSLSASLITKQYEDINRLDASNPVDGVIINGDITAFGHEWQFNKIISLMGILKPMYFPGLGNHDYENNINDCQDNNCADRMLSWFERWRNDHKSYINTGSDHWYASYYEFPEQKNARKGSESYTFDRGKIRFFQLNNYPSYRVAFNAWKGGINRNYWNITSSIDWLEEQFKIARNEGRFIVLNYHQANVAPTPEEQQRLTNLYLQYGVSAIFNGHLHSQNGRTSDVAGIPVYLSGSASRETYLRVEYDQNAKTGKVYLRYKNDYNDANYQEKFVETFPLKN